MQGSNPDGPKPELHSVYFLNVFLLQGLRRVFVDHDEDGFNRI